MAIDHWPPADSHTSDTYIGGHWQPSHGEQLITVTDPNTESSISTVRESSEDDVLLAVDAAQTALPAVASFSHDDRIGLLLALADQLEQRSDRLANVITVEMGMPVKHSMAYQVLAAINTLRATADTLADVQFVERAGHSTVRREPVGVVAAITAWNYPLLQAVSKIGLAIGAGCSIVLKPSEQAPLDALILANALDDAGFPPGTVNLVFGTGPDVGEALVRAPGVNMVSLTGSTRAGRRVLQTASAGIKRVVLELGGKSPAVILPDADLEAAVAHSVESTLLNSGQTCTAISRLLVPFQQLADAEELVRQSMRSYRVGPSTNADTDIGPLANANQHQHVVSHLERAPLDGATLVHSSPDELPDRGYFVPAQAHTVTDPRIRMAQDEIFGPVLAIMPYVEEDDAVTIANGTDYGLAATVWSSDDEHALDVANRIEAGTVDINGTPFNPDAPVGGYKQSGLGRELGVHGILEFTETKSVQHKGRQ